MCLVPLALVTRGNIRFYISVQGRPPINRAKHAQRTCAADVGTPGCIMHLKHRGFADICEVRKRESVVLEPKGADLGEFERSPIEIFILSITIDNTLQKCVKREEFVR